LNATDNSGVVVYTISYGSTPTVVTQNGTSGSQKTVVITGLTPATEYTFYVEVKDNSNNPAANNPIAITVTTTNGLSDPAPTPTIAVDKVISIYSDAYSSVPGLNLNPNWGQSTIVSEIQVKGNNTLKYENLNYQGTEFSHITPLASGMTHLHIDVWTENETSLQLYPICWNGSANEPEKYVTLSPLNFSKWNNYDIPLTDFTNQGLTMSDVYQFKIVGSGSKTIYIDNLYFYNDLGTSVKYVKNDNLFFYSSVVKENFVVRSKTNIVRIEFHNLLGQIVKNVEVNGLEKNINISDFSHGNYICTLILSNGESVKLKLIKE
jgi:chitodextrinase